jgi:hypothetical protein
MYGGVPFVSFRPGLGCGRVSEFASPFGRFLGFPGMCACSFGCTLQRLVSYKNFLRKDNHFWLKVRCSRSRR